MLANAAVNVAEVFLAREVFDGGDFGYGCLVAATAVGLVAGSLVGGGMIDRWGMRVPYALAIALMGSVSPRLRPHRPSGWRRLSSSSRASETAPPWSATPCSFSVGHRTAYGDARSPSS